MNRETAFFLAIALLSVPMAASSEDGGDPEAVVIETSASTNSSGYRMVVDPSGHFVISPFEEDPSHGPADDVSYGSYSASPEAVKQLLAHLDAAAPLSKLQADPIAKSASFGNSVHIIYRGEKSPDLESAGQWDELLSKDIRRVQFSSPGLRRKILEKNPQADLYFN